MARVLLANPFSVVVLDCLLPRPKESVSWTSEKLGSLDSGGVKAESSKADRWRLQGRCSPAVDRGSHSTLSRLEGLSSVSSRCLARSLAN